MKTIINFQINKMVTMVVGCVSILIGLMHVSMGIHYFRSVENDLIAVEILSGAFFMLFGVFAFRKKLWAFGLLSVVYAVQGCLIFIKFDMSGAFWQVVFAKDLLSFFPIIFLASQYLVWKTKKIKS